eukprot:1084705-Pleurochrysis_carterae.AAC.1
MGQVVGCGCLSLMKGEGHAVRKVRFDEVSDVPLLRQGDAVGLSGDVYIQEVRDRTLFFDIPARKEV